MKKEKGYCLLLFVILSLKIIVMKMLRFYGIIVLLLFSFTVVSQSYSPSGRYFTEASSLTMVGKMLPTVNPYHRLTEGRYEGFTATELRRLGFPAGLAVAFKTNTRNIYIYTDYADASLDPIDAGPISYRGYDLYIRQDGQWRFAASKAVSTKGLKDTMLLLRAASGQEMECLLYLPLNSELNSVQIGVDASSFITPLEQPFRHRIGVHGSSYTHGASTVRAGMSYPSQLERMTGLQMLNLGCSGRAKLQPYFAQALADAQMDALLLDVFSNPSPQEIKERLFPFIEIIQAAHPDMPIIFQRTIYREGRTFDTDLEAEEAAKMRMADSLMALAVKKYKHVYYIVPNPTNKEHTTTVDGVHPDNYGYTLWAESIRKPLLKILKKYGIK